MSTKPISVECQKTTEGRRPSTFSPASSIPESPMTKIGGLLGTTSKTLDDRLDVVLRGFLDGELEEYRKHREGQYIADTLFSNLIKTAYSAGYSHGHADASNADADLAHDNGIKVGHYLGYHFGLNDGWGRKRYEEAARLQEEAVRKAKTGKPESGGETIEAKMQAYADSHKDKDARWQGMSDEVIETDEIQATAYVEPEKEKPSIVLGKLPENKIVANVESGEEMTEAKQDLIDEKELLDNTCAALRLEDVDMKPSPSSTA